MESFINGDGKDYRTLIEEFEKERAPKMKSLLGKLGVILIGLAIFGNAGVWGADWKVYGRTSLYFGFYDAENITKVSKDIIRVWGKRMFTEKGVIHMVTRLGKSYEDLSHCIILVEVNCKDKKNRIIQDTHYSKNGLVISSDDWEGSKWSFIPPDSADDELYKAVCK